MTWLYILAPVFLLTLYWPPPMHFSQYQGISRCPNFVYSLPSLSPTDIHYNLWSWMGDGVLEKILLTLVGGCRRLNIAAAKGCSVVLVVITGRVGMGKPVDVPPPILWAHYVPFRQWSLIFDQHLSEANNTVAKGCTEVWAGGMSSVRSGECVYGHPPIVWLGCVGLKKLLTLAEGYYLCCKGA